MAFVIAFIVGIVIVFMKTILVESSFSQDLLSEMLRTKGIERFALLERFTMYKKTRKIIIKTESFCKYVCFLSNDVL